MPYYRISQEGQLYGVDADALHKELRAVLTAEQYAQVDITGAGVSCPVEASAIVLAHGSQEQVETRALAKAIARVKEIRAKGEEFFTKNSGVALVYQINYEAAMLGATDNTTILRTGKTPQEHLAAKGARMINATYPTGMTAAQFADYVIQENRGESPYSKAMKKGDEIEDEYLRVRNVLLPAAADEAEREVVIAAYQTFCDARTI